MSREQAVLWLAEAVMFTAQFCFLRAFWLRKRDNRRHQQWGKRGAACVLLGLLTLEILMRGAGWEFPVRSETMLRWHVGISIGSFLLLVLMVVTGMVRIRRVHVRLYLLFLPCFAASIVTSFFAFQLW